MVRQRHLLSGAIRRGFERLWRRSRLLTFVAKDANLSCGSAFDV